MEASMEHGNANNNADVESAPSTATVLADGLIATLRPIVLDCDSSIQNVFRSQQQLSQQLDLLTTELSKITQLAQIACLEPYAQKLANARRRMGNINVTLSQINTRVLKLQRTYGHLTAQQQTAIPTTQQPPPPQPQPQQGPAQLLSAAATALGGLKELLPAPLKRITSEGGLASSSGGQTTPSGIKTATYGGLASSSGTVPISALDHSAKSPPILRSSSSSSIHSQLHCPAEPIPPPADDLSLEEDSVLQYGVESLTLHFGNNSSGVTEAELGSYLKGKQKAPEAASYSVQECLCDSNTSVESIESNVVGNTSSNVPSPPFQELTADPERVEPVEALMSPVDLLDTYTLAEHVSLIEASSPIPESPPESNSPSLHVAEDSPVTLNIDNDGSSLGNETTSS